MLQPWGIAGGGDMSPFEALLRSPGTNIEDTIFDVLQTQGHPASPLLPSAPPLMEDAPLLRVSPPHSAIDPEYYLGNMFLPALVHTGKRRAEEALPLGVSQLTAHQLLTLPHVVVSLEDFETEIRTQPQPKTYEWLMMNARKYGPRFAQYLLVIGPVRTPYDKWTNDLIAYNDRHQTLTIKHPNIFDPDRLTENRIIFRSLRLQRIREGQFTTILAALKAKQAPLPQSDDVVVLHPHISPLLAHGGSVQGPVQGNDYCNYFLGLTGQDQCPNVHDHLERNCSSRTPHFGEVDQVSSRLVVNENIMMSNLLAPDDNLQQDQQVILEDKSILAQKMENRDPDESRLDLSNIFLANVTGPLEMLSVHTMAMLSGVIEVGHRVSEMMNCLFDHYTIGDFRDQANVFSILSDSWRLLRHMYSHLTSLYGVQETNQLYMQGYTQLVQQFNVKKTTLFNYQRQKGVHKQDQILEVTVPYCQMKEIFTCDFPKKAGYTLIIEQSGGNMYHAYMTGEVLDLADCKRGRMWVKSKKFPFGKRAWASVTFHATWTPIFDYDVVVAQD
eukprot:TRINITY_DN10855_c0_g1_i2.p1 TRINITY_DN10855_c0_g1~~TRINITY_DN10855_c0_g1_i2.p1  ORF type:complete len:556 (-),score=46.66 TRINITY_DN10855_c0_g1_i2:70-1737(-)